MSPEAILAKSTERVVAIKTAEYDGTIELASVPESEKLPKNSQFSVAKLTFYGSIDTSDPENLKSEINVTVKMNPPAENTLPPTVHFIETDGAYYFKLDNIPTLEASDLSVLGGQWLAIDPQKNSGGVKKHISGSESDERIGERHRKKITSAQIEQVRTAIKNTKQSP